MLASKAGIDNDTGSSTASKVGGEPVPGRACLVMGLALVRLHNVSGEMGRTSYQICL